MRLFLLILMLLFAMPASAQNGAFRLLSICQAENNYHLNIEVSSDVLSLQLNPSHSARQEWVIENEMRHRFAIGLNNDWVEIRAFLIDNRQPIQMLYFEGLGQCTEDSSEAPPQLDPTIFIEALQSLDFWERN